MTESSPKPTRQFRGKLTRTSLLLLLPLTLIPVTIMGIITLANTNNFLRDQIITQFINVGDKQGELIDTSVKERESYLETASKDGTFRFSLDALLENPPDSEEFQNARKGIETNYQRLNRAQTENFFSHFLVVSPDKEILFATYPLWQGKIMDQNVYDELFIKPTSIGIFNVFPFYTEEFTDQFLVFSSQPLYDEFGNYTGAIIGITAPAVFQHILELGTLSYAETRPYYITHPKKDGVFVELSATTGELTAFEPSPDHIEIVIPRLMDNNNEGVVEYKSVDEVPVLGYTKWLSSIDVAIALEAPQSVISQPLQKSAFLQVALLVIALIVLGFVIWQGTRRIVQPILQVSQTAHNFADGDLAARAPVTRNDEIGLLADSFNQVADQLVALYRSLENQVEQRTQQIRTAADVAQISTSSDDLDVILASIVQLIAERFGYYHAAIYMLDRSGDHVILRQAAGQAAQEFISKGFQIAIGSRSIVGNVAATNQPWIAYDVKQDPYYLEIASLPETKSEVAVPLSVGDRVLGVLDIQSNQLKTFDQEEITTLQTLASQIASALRNIRLLENTKIDLQSTNLLYQTSHRLADVTSTGEAIEVLADILMQGSYIWATFIYKANQLQSVSRSTEFALNPRQEFSIPVTQEQIQKYTQSPSSWDLILIENPPAELGEEFLNLMRKAGCQAFIMIPLLSGDHFSGLIILGSDTKENMTPSNLEPYFSIGEMVNTSLEKIDAIEGITQSYSELQSLSSISQAISTETELSTLFEILHRQIIQAMGEVNFLVALYDTNSEMIEIPYMTEKDQIINLPTFPLGQGLTSIVIRSQQPLMIVEDTVNRTRSLGAIITSEKQAKSWLGVPMIIAGEVVGAIVVQDTEEEYRFDDDDLRLLTTLAGQVAPIIRNTRLLAEAQETSERDRQLYEITDSIRRATSFQSIIEITTQTLSNMLNLKKAKIEILADSPLLAGHDNGSEEKTE